MGGLTYRIDIAVDEDVLKEVLVALKIDHNPPTITFNWSEVDKYRKGINVEEYGHYLPAENHVAIQTLPETYQRLPLFQLQPKVRETLLHELRHAHQYMCWPDDRKARMTRGPYWERDCEIDARKWAYEQREKGRFKKLIALTRQETGVGMRLP